MPPVFNTLAANTPLYLQDDFITQGKTVWTKGQKVFFKKDVPGSGKPPMAIMVDDGTGARPVATTPALLDLTPPAGAIVAAEPPADEDEDDGISGATYTRFETEFLIEHPLVQALVMDYLNGVPEGREDTSFLDMAANMIGGTLPAGQRYTVTQTAALYRQFLAILGVEASAEGLAALASAEAPPAPPVAAKPTGKGKGAGAKVAEVVASAPVASAPTSSSPPNLTRQQWSAAKTDALSLLVPGMTQAYVNNPDGFEQAIDIAKRMVYAASAVN